MNKTTLVFLLLFFTFPGWSQINEINSQSAPFIEIKDLAQDEKPVRISQVKIDVKVVGSLAVTTVDMTLHNPNNRILEGEMQFPLAEGQSVSRFALDIGGKLREGVTVEKAKGQATFESVVRQNVDPGLLEKTVGNNFRTRVYPLPKNGTRRVVIAYEQELDKKENSYRFHLPIDYQNILDVFDINLSVYGNFSKPQIENTPWSTFNFNKKTDAYIATYSAKNYKAKGQIVFSVPIKNEDNTFVEKGKISGEHIFYTKIFPEIKQQEKLLPKSIDMYWDISGSMVNRNLELELQLLEKYLSKVGDLTINLYTFNIFLNKAQSFTIKNGNCQELKTKLQNVSYDGATQFGVLDFSKSKADEILLFSDGLSNFGPSTPQTGKTAVTVVTSSLNSDHSKLQYQALSTGGKYINLMKQTPDEAVNMLMNESFRVISVDYNRKEISDFTSSGIIIKPESGYSMAGKLLTSKATVTIKFGIGNKVLHTETILLNTKKVVDYNNIVERIWAAKKISELDLMYENNKGEIENLGKKYNIVTRNTSLIVLETVEDYIRYEIIPPTELLEEYNQIVKERECEESEEKEDRIEDLISMLEERLEWWNTTFDVKPKKREKKPASRSTPTNLVRPTAGKVNGIVTDTYGEPIIGVNVVIKGTTVGTVTNMDGGFAINANIGETLTFTYIGFIPIEKVVTASVADVIMQEDRQQLDEVVVTSYGVRNNRKESETGSSVDIPSEINLEISEMLQGRVAGLESEGDATIRIRGNSSVSSSSTPLYIVDGIVVDNPGAINPEDIKSISVLKDASTTAIYGLRAADGVIIINTRSDSGTDYIEDTEEILSAKGITLKNWMSDAPYMQKLKECAGNKLYFTYLELRKEYSDTPSFFLDAATIFEERGLKQESLLILSNLAEMNLQNYRLMRVLGHRLMQLGYTAYAINQFDEVLSLRPEEPQSYRDLALAHEQNKDYQKAIDLLYKSFFKEWDDRFDGIEIILIEEMNHVIAKAKWEGVKLNLKDIDKRLIHNMPVDIRIVLNWDTDNSDMDLWVTDPNGEKCYYQNTLTEIGGMISDDFTDGYGPEEFLIKKARKGKYKIEANYFGTREQTLIGPTTVYLDIFTNYGRSNEKKQTIMLQLTENKEKIEIGEVGW